MAFNLYLLKMRFRDFMSSIKEINFRSKCSLSIMFVCQSGLRPVIISKVDYENKSLIEVENLLCWSWEEEDVDVERFSLVFVRRASKK